MILFSKLNFFNKVKWFSYFFVTCRFWYILFEFINLFILNLLTHIIIWEKLLISSKFELEYLFQVFKMLTITSFSLVFLTDKKKTDYCLWPAVTLKSIVLTIRLQKLNHLCLPPIRFYLCCEDIFFNIHFLKLWLYVSETCYLQRNTHYQWHFSTNLEISCNFNVKYL